MTLAPNWASTCAWPLDRMGDALRALATAAGIATRAVDVPQLAFTGDETPARIDDAIARCGDWLDVDAEPVDAKLSDFGALLAGSAPALIRVGVPAQLLALVGTRARTAYFLTPAGAIVAHPLADLRDALTPAAVKEGAAGIESMLERIAVPEARRAHARELLARERYANFRIDGLWLVRRTAGSAFMEQLRGAGIFKRIAALATLHTLQMVLFTLSWGLLGATALAGNPDTGMMIAWALLLVTIVPLRAAAARVEGGIAVQAGMLLKRRLLRGALALDPDHTKTEGAGRMLGRVLESEAVEQLALDAGGAVLFTAIDLVFAIVVLALGAAPAFEMAMLVLTVLVAGLIARTLVRRRSEWTDARLALTHDMVERLIGHRTRIAQEARGTWHHAEDEAAARTLDAARRLDRLNVMLDAFVPRAWLIGSIAALAVVLVNGPRQPTGVAITIGGALIAFRALKRAARGTSAVAGVIVAWRRVQPLFDAAVSSRPPVSPRVAIEREARTRAPDEVLIDARDLTYRYAARPDPILDGVTFTLKRSDHALLLGPSGGGKSTLGALLAGLRQPASGILLLDGLDGPTLGTTAWRRLVASAPQFHENHVLGSTFAFNVLMGRAWPPSAADLEEADEVCRELDLGPLLDRMPAGLDQTVGETGWQLSHGERSRLFLARALLQRAELVVLDESFAALDPSTLAKAVACARRRAKALVVIAHP